MSQLHNHDSTKIYRIILGFPKEYKLRYKLLLKILEVAKFAEICSLLHDRLKLIMGLGVSQTTLVEVTIWRFPLVAVLNHNDRLTCCGALRISTGL